MTHTDQSRALLPCPFCGEVPILKPGEDVTFIVCPKDSTCAGSGLAIGFENGDERAIEAWNRRAALNHKAADVVLPEPVAHINQNGVIHEAGYEWGRDNHLSALYTEQTVRALLATERAGLQALGCMLPAPSEPQGWFPITTAPLDGRMILLATPKGRIADGCYHARYGVWSWPYVMVKPTHWMPLPQPPKEQT